MKYGLILFKETTNIGDDVQAYAVAQFLPRVDMMLDREHLDELPDDEPIAAVMNGWFLHRKWNWPPANSLRPLLLAFHYSDYERAKYYGKHIKTTFLQGPGLEYLRAWGPVGCRDINTMELLQKMGVESYFSGCMTLTLPQMPRQPQKKKYCCLVDLNVSVTDVIRKQAEAEHVEPRIMTHLVPAYPENATWEERARGVEKLLTIYQNAECVITSRLHCALPCLALGTPVLLVRSDLDNIRFQPYVNWMHTAKVEEVLQDKLDYSFANPPANSGAHLETRNKLIDSVKQFVASAESAGSLESKYELPELERLRWQHEVLRDALETNLEAYKFDMMKVKKAPSNWKKVLHNLRVYGFATTLRKIKSNLRGNEKK